MKSMVVIPTYDEAVALPALLDRLLQFAPEFHILIVDDNSPDGTGRLADDYATRNDTVQVLHRPGKMGLGSAYRDGFRFALDNTDYSNFDFALGPGRSVKATVVDEEGIPIEGAVVRVCNSTNADWNYFGALGKAVTDYNGNSSHVGRGH